MISISSLKPKEAIIEYNKIYLLPMLKNEGFTFKPNSLEYTKKTKDFKYVINHRCSRTNMQGLRVDFGINHYMESFQLKKFIKKNYPIDNRNDQGQIRGVISPYRHITTDKFLLSANTFNYGILDSNAEEEFTEIQENIRNYVIPTFEYFSDYKNILKSCLEYSALGDFMYQNVFRKLNYAMFINDKEEIHQIKRDLSTKYKMHPELKVILLERYEDILNFRSLHRN